MSGGGRVADVYVRDHLGKPVFVIKGLAPEDAQRMIERFPILDEPGARVVGRYDRFDHEPAWGEHMIDEEDES